MDMTRLDVQGYRTNPGQISDEYRTNTGKNEGFHQQVDGKLDSKELLKSIPQVLFNELTRNCVNPPCVKLNESLGITPVQVETLGLTQYRDKLASISANISELIVAKTLLESETKLTNLYNLIDKNSSNPTDLAVIILYNALSSN